MLIWFADDDVWHERVLLWPVGRKGTKSWVIATPDHKDEWGVYIEDYTPGGDVAEVRPCAPDGSRPYLDEMIYSFADVFDDPELHELLKKGRTYARDEYTATGGVLDPPVDY